MDNDGYKNNNGDKNVALSKFKMVRGYELPDLLHRREYINFSFVCKIYDEAKFKNNGGARSTSINWHRGTYKITALKFLRAGLNANKAVRLYLSIVNFLLTETFLK